MVRGQTVYFVLALVLAINTTAKAQYRVWKDSTGKFEVRAIAVKFDGKIVYLSTENQKLLKVPLAKLATADKDYLAKNRILGSLHLMALFRYRDAFDLISDPETPQEKAIYATLIGANLTQYSVPEYDRQKAGKIATEIYAELQESKHPIDWYLIANLKFRIRTAEQGFEKVDVDLIKKSSSAKVPYATNRLAACFLDGIGVEQDEKRALQLFQSIAEDYASPVGVYNVGVCHYQGRGTGKNTTTGKKNFKLAAQLGMVLGISAMTRSILEELNSIKIPANLPDLRRRAGFDRNAARELKKLESGVKKKKRLLDSAASWSKKLIDAKAIEGHFYLGLCHLQKAASAANIQMKQNEVETAYRLFDQAAKKDHIQSILMLLKKAIAENQMGTVTKLVKQLESIPITGLDKKIVAAVEATLAEAKKKM